MFLRACTAAGWNDAQRYIAMRHVGCPLQSGATPRPSVKHARNTNAHFEQLMALAESAALCRGAKVPPPRERASWREAAATGRMRLVNLARQIIAEAVSRVPEVFNAGLETYIVAHVCKTDADELVMVTPQTLDEVDGGQAHRIVEALRAYVGRHFLERGMTPTSFEVPPSARARAARQSRPRERMEGAPADPSIADRVNGRKETDSPAA